MKKKHLSELMECYVNTGGVFKNELTLDEFGVAMLKCTTKLIFDLAPSNESAVRAVLSGIDSGIEWHMNERDHDTEECARAS